MVQAAGDVRGMQHVALPDGPGGFDRGTDHVCGGLMHLWEAIGVTGAEPVLQVRHVGVLPRAFHRGDVLRRVHGPDQRVIGHRRGDHLQQIQYAESPGQPHSQIHPDRTHRMAVTEVVGRQPLIEDQHRLTTHALTIRRGGRRFHRSCGSGLGRPIAENGYDRTTIRSIAAAAGSDPALVMRYFGLKEKLFAQAATIPADGPITGSPEQIAELLAAALVQGRS
jgi:hypothetical protein